MFTLSTSGARLVGFSIVLGVEIANQRQASLWPLDPTSRTWRTCQAKLSQDILTSGAAVAGHMALIKAHGLQAVTIDQMARLVVEILFDQSS